MTPDAAWISLERLNTVPPEKRAQFLPVCPDFVIELRLRCDNLKPLQEKMEEWVKLGVKLGWLIDPTNRIVYIYRRGKAVERLDNPAEVKGDRILPNLTLDLTSIW